MNAVDPDVFLKETNSTNMTDKNLRFFKANCENICNFINELNEIGVTVTFQHYEPSTNSNRLHGRYWITPIGGYIVDGSLNSIEKSVVLVQKMDDENFRIIQKFINENIRQDRSNYPKIDSKTLCSTKQLIIKHVCEINGLDSNLYLEDTVDTNNQ